MKVGVIIINYNCPNLLVPQLEGLRRFCKDDYEIVVVDNSSDPEASEGVRYHSEGCLYIRSHSGSHGGSKSHAFACNLAWMKLHENYDYLLFLDHDNLPIKDFSVVEMLKGRAMVGLGQGKVKTYYWPGFVAFDLSKVKEADFSCNSEYGLDTGGNLYLSIEKAGIENCGFVGEEYFENPYFVSHNPKYNYYTVIAGGFLHFCNGSGWEKLDRNEERINSLLNIVKERTA